MSPRAEAERVGNYRLKLQITVLRVQSLSSRSCRRKINTSLKLVLTQDGALRRPSEKGREEQPNRPEVK